MRVNLRPHSERGPLYLEQGEYNSLSRRTEGGWSHCADETEWLAKLHYLRAGFQAGKMSQADFEERELRLVQAWLNKLI